MPVDGDTYDIPAIIETAETRQRVHGFPPPKFGHRVKFGDSPEKHRDFSAVTHVTKDKGIPSQGVRARPYDSPYRALIAKDVDGLLLAGRCISGDFLAHSSYRVTGNAVAMGEAAGRAAAKAIQANRLPQDL